MVAKPEGLGIRHVQYLMLFLGMTICFGMRTIMNVAVVGMLAEKQGNEAFNTYPEWSDRKNLLLSSFFWGYIILQVPAGKIAQKFGPKRFLATAICITSTLCALVPVLADNVGFAGVLASRVTQGLTQAFLFPSCHHLMSTWTTPMERAQWGTIVYSGTALGNVIAMPVTGFLCASSLGWPAIFYLYGAVGIAWGLLFFIFGSNSPTSDKSISDEEKQWLENVDNKDEDIKVPTPWLKMFSSPSVLAIILAHMGQNWGFYTLLTEIPSYMENILHFNIKDNSLLSALPYLMMWILSMIISPWADVFIKRDIISVGTSRKIFNTFGLGGPAMALIILSLVGSGTKEVVVSVLVLGVTLNAFQFCGFSINHIDLSPVHSGTLMGITNCFATVCSIFAPLAVDVVKMFGYEETDVALWNIIFGLAAGILIFDTVVFIIFGSGEIQEWNYPEDKSLRENIREMSLRKISQPKISLSWAS